MSTAQAHVFDADDYPAAVTREIPGLGECRVGDLLMDEAMRLFAVDRPHRLDYRRWVSDFLATSLAHPRLDVREIDDLSDLARERLRAAAAEANGCGSAHRALAGSHLSRDERLFAAYYSTMREHFVSLARVGVGIAAQATAGLVRAAVPVVRPLVAHSAARIVQTRESLASTVNRGVARRVERLSRPDVWVPPRVQIPGRSIETIAATAMSRQLDNMARVVVANREPLRGAALRGAGGSAVIRPSVSRDREAGHEGGDVDESRWRARQRPDSRARLLAWRARPAARFRRSGRDRKRRRGAEQARHRGERPEPSSRSLSQHLAAAVAARCERSRSRHRFAVPGDRRGVWRQTPNRSSPRRTPAFGLRSRAGRPVCVAAMRALFFSTVFRYS